MKSFNKLAGAVILAFGFTLPSFALTFSDTTGAAAGGSPVWLSTGGQTSVTGVLDITTGNAPNYNPATMVLTSATVKFAFADTLEKAHNYNDEHDVYSWDQEFVTIKLGNPSSNFLTGVEVDGTHAAYDWTNAAGSLAGTFFTQLQFDGKLEYKVKITSGDVWFKGANLTAEGSYKGVPDAGSTVALMGMGLVGLAAIKRRR